MSTENIVLTATVNGEVYTLENPAQSIIDGLLLRGFQKVLTDAHSTATRGSGDDKRKATDSERADDVKARLAKLADGTYTFGGGGSRHSIEDKALIFTLKKFGVEWDKSSTIETGLEILAKATAEKAEKEYTDDMPEKIREQLVAHKVYRDKLAALKAEAKTKNVSPTDGLTL